jgi:hypothetical protein
MINIVKSILKNLINSSRNATTVNKSGKSWSEKQKVLGNPTTNKICWNYVKNTVNLWKSWKQLRKHNISLISSDDHIIIIIHANL